MSAASPAAAAASLAYGAGATLAAACSADGVAPQALSSLGAQLLGAASASASAANLIISPLSIYIALVLALNAAGMTSQTHAELLRALCLASRVGSNGYSLLAPPQGIGAGDAKKAEGFLNNDVRDLLRSLVTLESGGGTILPPPTDKAAGAAAGGAGSKNTTTAATADAPQLLLANSLWTQEGPNGANISSAYAARMALLFNAVAKKGDADAVNAWAKEATRGLIEQAVAPGTKFDLLLANAVYFKGKWERAFNKDATLQDADFSALTMSPSSFESKSSGSNNKNNKAATTAATKTTTTAAAAASSPLAPALAYRPSKVQMMQLRVKASEDRQAQREGSRTPLIMMTSQFIAVRLPYRGGTQSAVFVLPSDTSPGGLRSLLTSGGQPFRGQGAVNGSNPFDWRRDLALARVPEPWLESVSKATGRSAGDLERGGRVASPPVVPVPPPELSAGAADPSDRLLPMPRLIPSNNNAPPPRRPQLSVEDPPLPMGEQWMPSSVRSGGGLELQVPKFRAETKQLRLKALLSADASKNGLGVSAAFDPLRANFLRALEGGERLAVDDVIHSAVAIVDEEGTEAAAVTAVVMMRSAAPMYEDDPPIRIVFDRPFLFGVVDDASGTPLFTGSVVDPVWSERA